MKKLKLGKKLVRVSSAEIAADLKKREAIDRKLSFGTPLSPVEICFICSRGTLSFKRKYVECDDIFFREYFLSFNDNDKFLSGRLTTLDHYHFLGLLIKWEQKLLVAKTPDALIKTARSEFKYELNQFKGQNSLTINSTEYKQKYGDMLAWAKMRTMMVEEIFRSEIQSLEYNISFQGQILIFDRESSMHILSRHFAHGMKRYYSSRSHFYDFFHPKTLHLAISSLLKRIDQSTLYLGQRNDQIDLVYKGKTYRISTKVETFYIPGKSGPQKKTRITSFHEINQQTELTKIQSRKFLKKIDAELSVYVH